MQNRLTQYVPSDQKTVKQLVLTELKEFGFSYNPEYDFDLDDPSIYEKNGGMFYVLKIDEKVIGTVAIINKGNHIAELKRWYVDKNYQGKGYGAQLLNK